MIEVSFRVPGPRNDTSILVGRAPGGAGPAGGAESIGPQADLRTGALFLAAVLRAGALAVIFFAGVGAAFFVAAFLAAFRGRLLGRRLGGRLLGRGLLRRSPSWRAPSSRVPSWPAPSWPLSSSPPTSTPRWRMRRGALAPPLLGRIDRRPQGGHQVHHRAGRRLFLLGLDDLAALDLGVDDGLQRLAVLVGVLGRFEVAGHATRPATRPCCVPARAVRPPRPGSRTRACGPRRATASSRAR